MFSYLIISRLCEGGKIRAKIGPVYTDPDPDPDTDQDPDQDKDLDPDLDKENFCLRDRFISYYIQIV
jgi:hypothetical protein